MELIENIVQMEAQFDLSPAQKRMWLVSQNKESSISYNIAWSYVIEGSLGIEKFRSSFFAVVNRHESLRSSFFIKDQTIRRKVRSLEEALPRFDVIDLRGSDAQDAEVKKLVDSLNLEEFDIQHGALVRAALVQRKDDDFLFILVMHHIASDGTSFNVFMTDLFAHYSGKDLPAFKMSLSECLDKQQKLLHTGLKEQERFWLEQFREKPGVLELPYDFSRPKVQGYTASNVYFSLGEKETTALKSLVRSERTTLFVTLLAAWKLLLHKLSQQEDIIVGVPFSGRKTDNMDHVSMFVNTLPLRSYINPDLSFKKYLSELTRMILEAYDNQDYPFEELYDKLKLKRELGRNAVFDVMFVLHDKRRSLDVPGLTVKTYPLNTRTSPYDLLLETIDEGEKIEFKLQYNTGLFRAETVNRFGGFLLNILNAISEAPAKGIKEIELLNSEEQNELLNAFTANDASYPKDKTIIGLFEEQVRRTPDRTALVFRNEELTYRELDERANQLGHYLKGRGVQAETLVPICIERSIEMIVGILGILKAGGAYVPVDPDYPQQRIGYMTGDTNAGLILCSSASRHSLSEQQGYELIELDSHWAEISKEPLIKPGAECHPSNLAYVIYTSGSTGRPKGVMIEHYNVVRLFETDPKLYDFNEEDVWTMFHSFCFDFSVWEMYGALFYGGRLVVVPKDTARDTKLFGELIVRQKVTVLNQTPSAFYVLQDYLVERENEVPVRYVIFGGEALNPAKVKPWFQSYPACRLVNMYGITETTVHVTYQPLTLSHIDSTRSIIGKPIPTLNAYILNKEGQLCPVGIPGELYIGGAGVARGYLNNPELTAQRFLPNPFREGDRLYRTGDLGRRMDNGDIEYLGRIDDQVKIRGYRIELGEIESVTNTLEEVSSSCVVIHKHLPVTNNLACYYVPSRTSLKKKEQELFRKRIDEWSFIYETEYAQEEEIPFGEDFNIVGWNDSFTGEAIPEVHMREWLDDILSVIRSQSPARVLEIGCGTGMIYYGISDCIRHYTGTDISHQTINRLTRRVSTATGHPPARFLVAAAHEIAFAGEEEVDTVILNSVIQYFPGEEYLSQVLDRSMTALNGHGRIIIGDVRDNRLLRAFHARVHREKLLDGADIKEFRWFVEKEALKDKELCVSPEYFYHLRSQYPQITHIDIQWKRGDHINELTLYRYTVIIHVGIEKEILQPGWQSWQDVSADTILENGQPVIAIKDFPNPRLWQERLTEPVLSDPASKPLRTLLNDLSAEDAETATVKALITSAASKGYACKFLLDEDPLKMNLVLLRGSEDVFIEPAYAEDQDFSHAVRTNIPLYSDITLDLQKTIRDQLLERLPEYMVPAKFLAAAALPLTSNGKVDRAFLSRQDDIQAKHTDTYTAPRSEVEERLASIWSELLGVEQVGVHDNFFELGGDSIITIQVISRARRWGYELQPRDLFTHQTISHLSKILSDRQQTITGEQGILSGDVPLLPMQQWYFEQDQPKPSHFNQSMVLGLSKEISSEILSAAVQELLKHHDALRFKYTRTGTGWKQEYAPYKEQPITLEDLREPGGSLSERITARANVYQASLNIEGGELLRAVWMQTPPDESHNRLLLVIHHLAVDGVSWRILLQDLELLLTGLMNGEAVTPGNKSSSIREWHKALQIYADRKQSQAEYWSHVLQQYKPLPTDFTAGDEITAGDTVTHIASLQADQTQKLLQEVSRAYHTEINDVLLAALAITLGEWSKSEQVSIGLEGHGREDISRDVDVTRTVGWFTSIYPVVLKTEESPAHLIKSIKEQLRSIPDKGIGYGVLKYLGHEEALQQNIAPDLVFNYLGQWDNMVGQSRWFKAAPEFSGETKSTVHRIPEKIAINSRVKGGQLSLYWTYSNKHYRTETTRHLAERYIFHLEQLILHCSKQAAEAFTPSDFGLAPEVSYRELDQFLQQPFNGRPRKELVESLYRLSGLQEGMLFHKLYDDRVNAYTEQFECELPGLNPEVFRECWQKIIRKHSIFRTGFYYDAFSIPVQCVYKEAVIPFETLDFRRMRMEEQQEAIDAVRIEDKTKPFDFEMPPLMRITLIRMSDDRYYMFWTHHHIILDGWSVQVLMTELLEYYQALVSGGRVSIGEEDKYEDYIRYIGRRDKEEEEEFWKKYLSGTGEGSLLPFIPATEERNKGIGSYRKEVLQLDSAVTALLSAYAQEHRLTLNTLMQGAWAYLLYRYAGNPEVTFGVTVSGRPDDLPDVENRVGIYINTLPFHVAVNEEQEIAEWLKQIQHHQMQSRSHQHTPLPHIRKWAGVQGDWFDSYLAFENYPVNKILETRNWALKMGELQVNEQTNYPLSIIIEASQEITVLFTYNASLLDEYYIRQIKSHFENLLEQIVRFSAVRELNLHTDSSLLQTFNQSEYAVDGGENTLVDLIEGQALRTPERVAVGFEGKKLSYAELDARSNQLAHYLIQRGVKADTLVPICINRSLEMMIGILGILKAGGAYVPIDPEYPQDRIEYMLSDTAASLVLCSSETHAALPQDYEAIELDGDWEQINTSPRHKPEVVFNASNLAYVIYTSGSTGRPKGVMIEHRGVVNRLLWAQAYYKMSQEDVFLQKTTFSFDVSVWELFWPLLIGARLELAKPGGHKDQEYLRTVIEESGVTIVHFVPSMLEVFLLDLESGACAGLKKVLCSGEALKSFHIQLFSERMPHAELHNLYGPTEASIDVTYWSAPSDASDTTVVPIGKPVSNTRLYILDRRETETAIGVPGELYIGGIQVARGYLNLPQQTEERFITRNGERLYKTGDLCRWLPDGNIEYLGRLDDQVKVRGYRIEPAEIETVLLQSGLVSQAVVVAKEDVSGNKQLTGYVVPSTQFDREAIRTYLHERLPEYMVPALFVSLKELPLTSSGKVDKKALPKADTGELLADRYLAPQTELEKKLAAVWQDLLGVKRVGVLDNFLELGGHSLLAIRLISILRRELGIELTIKDLFVHTTVQSLAKHLGQTQANETLPAISVQERPLRIPLSFGQERIWFLDQLEGSVSYHVPMALHFDGDPDISVLTSALKNIINRHEVLRTVLEEEEGLAYQRVLPKDSWTLEVISDPRYYENPEAVEELTQQLVLQPFDLSTDHKLRAHLVRTGSKESILVITIHHIAYDGLSFPIILRELKESYTAYSEGRVPQLPELTLQYADYSIWQRQYLTGERLSGMLQYWKEKLAGSQQLNLPADHPRPSVQSQRGAALLFTIEAELAEGLKKLSRQQGATLYMTLLAVFKVLLYRYSGQEDISVGTPVGNRQYQELENLVGFFVNTIVLRSDAGNNPPFRTFLQQVKDTLLEAYGNGDAPFEKVVEAIVTERDMSRSPLFQVMFVLQSDDDTSAAFTLPGVRTSFGPVTHTTSKFDLLFDVKEEAHGLDVFVEYDTDLFKESTVSRMFHHYKQLLKSVLASPATTIGSLPMLSAEEQRQISGTFNQSEYAVDGGENTLVHLLEEQALRTPERIAVGFEGKELSYAELDARSNQLAHYLIQRGVKADTLVPICIDRSLEMMIGILGILKAGGAYVPIDPEYPQDRIEYMLSDTAASLVLCSSETHAALPQNYEAVELDGDWEQINSLPRHKPEVVFNASNLAYVIYTSGSTGRPKGVMIEHRGVVNRLLWAQAYYSMSQQDVFLQKTTFSFDVSVWELFWPLLIGARLELARPGGHKDQEYLRTVIEGSGVTIVHFVPSMLEVFLLDLESGACAGLKKVLCSGEALKSFHVQLFRERMPHAELHNLYGPTEASIDVTYWSAPSGESDTTVVPIGKPVSNTRLYILDARETEAAIGVPGELYIGGIQVARGYLNLPQQTEERFITRNGERLYKTGDLCRWLPDGNIEYLGRLDDQVKVRGYRIEPAEIETVLLQSGLVSQAVVVAKEDANDKKLVAYYTTAESISTLKLRKVLNGKLPPYFIPSFFIRLDEIPLTASGKINRKHLQSLPLESSSAGRQVREPETEVEKNLAAILKDILSVDKVNMNDDFFSLGGSSILVIRAIALIKGRMGVRLSIRDFMNQSLSAIARKCEQELAINRLNTG